MPSNTASLTVSGAETKLEAAAALRAYQQIIKRGTQRGDRYELDGLTAGTDHDGYAITLSDGTVTLRLLFHNRVSIDAPNRRTLASFRRKLLAVAGDAT